jgi:hypothetical protein
VFSTLFDVNYYNCFRTVDVVGADTYAQNSLVQHEAVSVTFLSLRSLSYGGILWTRLPALCAAGDGMSPAPHEADS